MAVSLSIWFDNITQTQIGVNYRVVNANPFAAKIYLKRDDTGGLLVNGNFIPANTTYDNQYVLVSGLSPGTSYSYTLTVLKNSDSTFLDSTSNSATTVSPPFSFVPYNNFSFVPYYNFSFTPFSFTPTPPPAAPTGLTISNITTSSLRLSWSSVSAATGYDVYNNSTLVGSTDSATTYYDFTNLISGTAYTLGVRAKNSNGNSSISTIQGTTAVAPGRIYINDSWKDMSTYKRYDAATSSWKTITIFKRYNAATGQWEEITN